jgi:hypothetical protein
MTVLQRTIHFTWFTFAPDRFGLFLGGTPVLPGIFWKRCMALPGKKLYSTVKPVKVDQQA